MHDDTSREANRGATSRRSFLSALGGAMVAGAGASVAGAVTSPYSPTIINHFPRANSDLDDSAADPVNNSEVTDVAEDLASEWNDYFGRNSKVGSMDVRRGSNHSNRSESYVANNWEDMINASGSDEEVVHHFILSRAGTSGYGGDLVDAGPNQSAAVVTNWGGAKAFDFDKIATNIYKQETLHAFGVEHEHGNADYKSGWTTANRYENISPMATSYVRDRFGNPDTNFSGSGTTPDSFACGSSNGKYVFYFTHTTDVCSCAFRAAKNSIEATFF